MKKISNLAVIVAAAALLCGISSCDNTETITFKSAPIEMVGDPVKTDKSVTFKWKESATNNVLVTRQASGEEEVRLDEVRGNCFVDRVSRENQLKAGVEYTYRFYNTSDVSSARTTEYTLEKKYSCVERKVTFDSIAPAGTKLAPITKDQIKVESIGKNYLSVYVDDKNDDQVIWMNIYDKTSGRYISENDFNSDVGGIEVLKYNPDHDYAAEVGKWWPGDYYETSDAYIYIDNLTATLKNDISSFYIDIEDDYFEVVWAGKKDSTYEVSFEAFDNKDNAVALKKSTVDANAIDHDAFFTYKATGKVSALTDISKPTSIKTVKVIVKETVDGKIVSESEYERTLSASFTTYTEVDYLSANRYSKYNDETGEYDFYYDVTLYGDNLPNTVKLYYKNRYDSLYTEFKDGLKKNEYGNLVAEVSIDSDIEHDFKAVVNVDNAKWYDWEEGKTEEVVTPYY